MDFVEQMMNALDTIYPILKNLDNVAFYSVIGVAMDQYGADHDMSTEEIIDHTKDLLKTQISAHEALGMMEKSYV